MDTKDIDRLILGTNQGPSPINGITKLVQQMEHISGYLQHLEQGLISMSHEVQAQGLGFQMTMRILIEKGLCTEEEIKQYHNTYVFKPMKESIEQMKMEIEQAQETIKNSTTEETINQEQTSASEEEDYEGDVVLASEKANNVLRFPTNKVSDDKQDD